MKRLIVYDTSTEMRIDISLDSHNSRAPAVVIQKPGYEGLPLSLPEAQELKEIFNAEIPDPYRAQETDHFFRSDEAKLKILEDVMQPTAAEGSTIQPSIPEGMTYSPPSYPGWIIKHKAKDVFLQHSRDTECRAPIEANPINFPTQEEAITVAKGLTHEYQIVNPLNHQIFTIAAADHRGDIGFWKGDNADLGTHINAAVRIQGYANALEQLKAIKPKPGLAFFITRVV